jgi:hypothetical protein
MSAASLCRPFQGKRVLVVESEILVPFTLYLAMERLGAVVIGPVAFPDDVLMLAGDGHLDGAILDSRLPVDQRSAVHRILKGMHIPFVEACGCLNCISGHDGCYRMSDAENDLAILGRALFGGLPSGSRVHRHTFVSARRNYRAAYRGRMGARATNWGRVQQILWSGPN